MSDINDLLKDPNLVNRIQAIIENSATIEEAVETIKAQEFEKVWNYWPEECPYDCDHCRFQLGLE